MLTRTIEIVLDLNIDRTVVYLDTIPLDTPDRLEVRLCVAYSPSVYCIVSHNISRSNPIR